MGDFDLPAQVDLIIEHTGKTKITFIGHSQATSAMFYTLYDDRNYWWNRLNVIIALAPATRIDHTTSKLIKTVANDESKIRKAC